MPRPGKEPALTGSFSWLGEEAGGCAVVRSRSSVARAPPNRLGTSRIDQVQRKDRTSPAFCSLRAAALRARLPHRRARSSTARQADSYEKVVRRFTDITGKSRSRTRCRTTRLFSAVSRRDLSSKLTWVAHGRKAGVRPKVKTPSSPYKLAPSYMEAVLKYSMYLFIHLDSFELNVIPGDLLKASSSDRCTRAAR